MTDEQERILIVDDEAQVRRLLRQTLVGEGYHCLEAGSADEAVGMLRNDAVGLAILDINMPGKSGVEMLMEMKAGYPDTAVIMATANVEVGTAIHCMKRGAYDYITKPFNLEEIIFSARRALEKRRLELENREYQQHLEERVQEQAEKIRSSFLNAITALVYALEARDEYTSGHSQRVSGLAIAIAKELDMPSSAIEKVRLGGLLHDIGKIGVREAVLHKPSALTDEEYEHVMSHCEIGERILSPIVEDEEILKMIRHHHDQTKPETLPLGVSILAVADAYDAMTTDRPYRKALPVDEALDRVRLGAGTQFAPVVVDAFLRMFAAGTVSQEGKAQGK